MVAEVEGHLLLSRRIGLVIGVVCHHSDEAFVAGLYTGSCEVYGDRQITAKMFLTSLPFT